jgi:hypothetical protein
MWAHPAHDCASHALAYPQTGSAAYKRIPDVLPYVQAPASNLTAGGGVTGRTATRNAMTELSHFYGYRWPARWSHMGTISQAMKGLRK